MVDVRIPEEKSPDIFQRFNNYFAIIQERRKLNPRENLSLPAVTMSPRTITQMTVLTHVHMYLDKNIPRLGIIERLRLLGNQPSLYLLFVRFLTESRRPLRNCT